MRPEITRSSALVLALAALLAGLLAGAALGVGAGYWLAGRGSPGRTAGGLLSPSGRPVALSQEGNAAVARANAAVVTVETLQRGSGSGDPARVAGLGSGFIIDSLGHIVTNQHVVAQGDAFTVIFSDGRKAAATLVGADQWQDVAVLATNGTPPGMVEWGDSGSLEPGQPVIAIGSALGVFRNTISEGVVSGGGRSLDTGEGYRLEHLVQHDAPITSGDSGGPLLDMTGHVVGMNTAIITGEFGQAATTNLSFAIEAATVRRFADELIASGHIERPYLGLTARPARQAAGSPADMSDSEPMPVVVDQVDDGGPAKQAGIAAADEITAVDGTRLDEQHQFLNLVFAHRPGDSIQLLVTHGTVQHPVSLILGNRPGP